MYLEFVKQLAKTQDEIEYLTSLCEISPSQTGIDIIVAYKNNFKSGFFVEFGAADGYKASNTYLLEKNFNWKGILVEPAKYFHPLLNKNRTVTIDHRCVAENSNNQIYFLEEEFPRTTYSHVHGYPGSTQAKYSNKYILNTVSLKDLLDSHNAPDVVDFLSIDTKGGEFEILRGYDFSRPIKIISIDWGTQYIKDKSQIHYIRTLLKDRYIEISAENSHVSYKNWADNGRYYNVQNSCNEGWFLLK